MNRKNNENCIFVLENEIGFCYNVYYVDLCLIKNKATGAHFAVSAFALSTYKYRRHRRNRKGRVIRGTYKFHRLRAVMI